MKEMVLPSLELSRLKKTGECYDIKYNEGWGVSLVRMNGRRSEFATLKRLLT